MFTIYLFILFILLLVFIFRSHVLAPRGGRRVGWYLGPFFVHYCNIARNVNYMYMFTAFEQLNFIVESATHNIVYNIMFSTSIIKMHSLLYNI